MGDILLSAGLALIKILGHSKLDSLEAKGNHLANSSTRNAAFKETIPLAWSKEISPNDDLEKLAGETQQLASEKKNKIGNPTIVLMKSKSSGAGQIATQSYQRLKSPLLTTIHALKHVPLTNRWHS